MTAVIFWDIDGTLLLTGRAGIIALERAVEEICGATCALDALATAGLTDAEVAALVLETAGVARDPETAERLLCSYERFLPDVLPLRRGRVLPGVLDVLTDLDGRPEVENLLLTGNTAAGAQAKLAHYGLDRFFPRGGAFCTGVETRPQIAARALELARELDGAGPLRLFVVGDTPHDIACGKAIGASTVAVASGGYSAPELAAHEPSLVLEQLPDPPAFRRLLGLPPAARSISAEGGEERDPCGRWQGD
jgi:phosphoglycolate phosphatase